MAAEFMVRIKISDGKSVGKFIKSNKIKTHAILVLCLALDNACGSVNSCDEIESLNLAYSEDFSKIYHIYSLISFN